MNMAPRPLLRTASALVLLAAFSAAAEDPYLGRIKAIKCVGCRPDWVEIIVHDPLDMRDYELLVKLSDYHKIVSPLPGKNIHDKDGSCFYWFETSKGRKPENPRPKPLPPPLPQGEDAPAGMSRIDSAWSPADSAAGPRPVSAPPAAADSALLPPPLPADPEGPPPKQSRCVPYMRPAPPPPSKEAR